MPSKCPFCKSELINSTVNCPNNKVYPCQECQKCHSYFYTKNNYMKLKDLARKNNQKLNSNVFYFSESIFKPKSQEVIKQNSINKLNNTKIKKKKTKNTIKQVTPKNINKIKYITDINIEYSKNNPKTTDPKSCKFHKNDFCNYMDDKCNPYSFRCSYKIKNQKSINNKTSDFQNELIRSNFVVRAIVLSNNRKCIFNNHKMQDIIAKINVATHSGKIKIISLPSVYCDICSTYYVLKEDYKKAKHQGFLLCSVDDRTTNFSKHYKNGTNLASESQIHKMGYNVRKNNGYTDIQRKIILANIIENTNITKHEILSIIDAGIARHGGQETYQNAVQCWIDDREFVSNYKTGDIPEVLIENIILKYNETN